MLILGFGSLIQEPWFTTLRGRLIWQVLQGPLGFLLVETLLGGTLGVMEAVRDRGKVERRYRV